MGGGASYDGGVTDVTRSKHDKARVCECSSDTLVQNWVYGLLAVKGMRETKKVCADPTDPLFHPSGIWPHSLHAIRSGCNYVFPLLPLAHMC